MRLRRRRGESDGLEDRAGTRARLVVLMARGGLGSVPDAHRLPGLQPRHFPPRGLLSLRVLRGTRKGWVDRPPARPLGLLRAGLAFPSGGSSSEPSRVEPEFVGIERLSERLRQIGTVADGLVRPPLVPKALIAAGNTVEESLALGLGGGALDGEGDPAARGEGDRTQPGGAVPNSSVRHRETGVRCRSLRFLP